MSELRKLKRYIQRSKERRRVLGVPMVWAFMMYNCEDCGQWTKMYLESSLERHNGKNHKPVPFGIICPNCGGFHCYDRSGLIKLYEERALRNGEHYFKDDPKQDCGIPKHPTKE